MYFGSVKFFKNMILLAVIVMIAVPSVFAIRLRMEVSRQAAEVSRLDQRLEEAQQTIFELLPDDNPDPAGGDDPPPSAEPVETDPAEDLYYQSLYPDFYAPQEYQATQRVVGTIYLTFDDGPSASTGRILEVLAAHDVKATFFVTGEGGAASGQRLRAIAEAGHTLGMHSYTHNYREIYGSVEAFLDDMYLIFSMIREETGVTPTVFRFPGGSINSYDAGIYQEILAEMMRRGFVPCDWNLSAEDAVSSIPSVSQIVQNVVGKAGNVERGFVLMHDSAANTTTVDALDTIIVQLKEMGFQFDRLTPETKPVLFGYKR